MKIVDYVGKTGEKAHVGSTTSERLTNIFQITGFMNIEVDKLKLTWFWRIMVGKGMKQIKDI